MKFLWTSQISVIFISLNTLLHSLILLRYFSSAIPQIRTIRLVLHAIFLIISTSQVGLSKIYSSAILLNATRSNNLTNNSENPSTDKQEGILKVVKEQLHLLIGVKFDECSIPTEIGHLHELLDKLKRRQTAKAKILESIIEQELPVFDEQVIKHFQTISKHLSIYRDLGMDPTSTLKQYAASTLLSGSIAVLPIRSSAQVYNTSFNLANQRFDKNNLKS